MELTEAAQRILRHHLPVIVLLFMAGLLTPVLLHAGQERSYVATSRVTIDGLDAKDADESSALADTALGIVTSPGQVRAALESAGVTRNARDVAENKVQIQPVGTSGVLELSVTDRDAEAAASMSTALAQGLVTLRSQSLNGESQRLLVEVGQRIEALNQEIRDIEEASASPDAAIETLRLRHTTALNNRSELQKQRQGLEYTLASTPKPLLIDAATTPTDPKSTGMVAQMIVGGLFGLALGLAIAALLEALHPTITSPDALSRTLGAPILSVLARPPQNAGVLADRWLPHYLSLAARDAGVQVARLVAVGPSVDLPRLARWLRDGADAFLEVEVAEPQGPGQRLARWMRQGGRLSPGVAVVELQSPGRTTQPAAPLDWESRGVPALRDTQALTGIVVVSPCVLRRDELTALEHHLAITHWPVLGIVAYRKRHFKRVVPPQGPSAPPEVVDQEVPRSTVAAS